MLPIAGKTAGLFGLTFFGHSGVTGGCSRQKNYYFFPKKVFKFFHEQRWAIQLVIHKPIQEFSIGLFLEISEGSNSI